MNVNRASSKVFSNNVRGVFSNVRNIRDQKKREAVESLEIQRRAYIFVARNTSLPATVRHKAQLGLNALSDGSGRPTIVRNRCVETGKGKGVLSKFGLCRYQFRLRALSSELPGVHKASW